MPNIKTVIGVIFIFLIFNCYVAQTTTEYKLQGRFWVSSSRSQGVLNGKTFYEAPRPLAHNVLLFILNTDTFKVQSNAEGYFAVFLKPGIYSIINQEVKTNKSPIPRIEPSFINLNANLDSLQVNVHYHVNGR